uniref:Uncharacterized protein n=1 Tax=Strongyloides papillosus TaxID=174720 RepID=A0A0N5BF37_STREA
MITKIFFLTLLCFQTLSYGRSVVIDNDEILALKKSIYVLLPIKDQNNIKNGEITEMEKEKPYLNYNKILSTPEIGIFWDLFGTSRKYMKRNSKKWTKLGPIWG